MSHLRVPVGSQEALKRLRGVPGETQRGSRDSPGDPKMHQECPKAPPEDTRKPRCMLFAILAKGPKGGPERNIAKHGVK